MAKNHTYYQPNDYEQMLIAAGWVCIEDIDEDYAKYRRAHCEPMSYEQWQDTRRSWDAMNNRFIELEQQYGAGTVLESEAKDEVNELLDDMVWLEVCLGY